MNVLAIVAVALVAGTAGTAAQKARPDEAARAFVTELHRVEGTIALHVKNRDYAGLKRQLPRLSGSLAQLHWTSSVGPPIKARCVVAASALYGLVITLQKADPSTGLDHDIREWSSRIGPCEAGVGRSQITSLQFRD